MKEHYKNNVIVAGSRIPDELMDKFYCFMHKNLLNALTEFNLYDKDDKIGSSWQNEKDILFISGGASTGADNSIINFCRNYKLSYLVVNAEWNKFGKVAGIRRNKKMSEIAIQNKSLGYLVAFWDGKSRGTKNMIENAIKNYLRYKVVLFKIENSEFYLSE